jgi:hypothetical protein
VFENSELRRIFGPKMDVISGGWKILHNEMFHKFYYSPNVIRTFESRGKVGECSMHWEECDRFGRKLQGKIPLGKAVP